MMSEQTMRFGNTKKIQISKDHNFGDHGFTLMNHKFGEINGPEIGDLLQLATEENKNKYVPIFNQKFFGQGENDCKRMQSKVFQIGPRNKNQGLKALRRIMCRIAKMHHPRWIPLQYRFIMVLPGCAEQTVFTDGVPGNKTNFASCEFALTPGCGIWVNGCSVPLDSKMSVTYASLTPHHGISNGKNENKKFHVHCYFGADKSDLPKNQVGVLGYSCPCRPDSQLTLTQYQEHRKRCPYNPQCTQYLERQRTYQKNFREKRKRNAATAEDETSDSDDSDDPDRSSSDDDVEENPPKRRDANHPPW